MQGVILLKRCRIGLAALASVVILSSASWARSTDGSVAALSVGASCDSSAAVNASPVKVSPADPFLASDGFAVRKTCRCSCGQPCKSDGDCGVGGVCRVGITCCFSQASASPSAFPFIDEGLPPASRPKSSRPNKKR